MNTIQDFIARHGIEMDCSFADRNPNMIDDGSKMDHWRCTFRVKDGRITRKMTVYFSMGVGHNGARPGPADVLDCLASDALGVHNSPKFEDWCAEYGYDTDSRKAERIHKVCERQAQKLYAFLGPNDFDVLLFNTERL